MSKLPPLRMKAEEWLVSYNKSVHSKIRIRNLEEKSEVVRAVIVRTCKELKRDDGMIIRYDDNAAVVIDQEGNPKGTRVFGAIAEELQQFNLIKIISLASEVL